MMRSHGIVSSNGATELHSRILLIIDQMAAFALPNILAGEQAWTGIRLTRTFIALHEKYKDLNTKRDRAATLFQLRRLDWLSQEPSDVDTRMRTEQDMTMYLDMISFYLRSELDTLAEITAFLSGHNGLPSKSFKVQRDEILRRAASEDSYRVFLPINFDWLTKLSDTDGRGLRDARIHGKDIYMITWPPDDPTAMTFETGFIQDLARRDSRPRYDVLVTLKDIVQGYFLYLDVLCEHIVSTLPDNVAHHVGAESRVRIGSPLHSAWLYPNLHTHGDEPPT